MSVFDQVAKYKADALQRAEKKLFRVCPLRGTDVTVVFAAEYLNDAQRIALRKIMRRAPFAWQFNTYAA